MLKNLPQAVRVGSFGNVRETASGAANGHVQQLVEHTCAMDECQDESIIIPRND